jgi:hypothetical protein
MNLGNVFPAMRAARQVREHGFPAEHAGARCQRLILQGNGHIGGKTSLFRLGLGSARVKAAAPESKQTRNPRGYVPSGNRCSRVRRSGHVGRADVAAEVLAGAITERTAERF